MPRTWRTHNLNRALVLLKANAEVSLKLGGQVLKQKMQEFSPEWTGQMVRSVEVGDVTYQDGAFRLLVGPTVDYAKYTELEPWIIGKRPGPKSQLKGAKIPWMRPAADEVRAEVKAIILKGFQTTVRLLQQGLKGLG